MIDRTRTFAVVLEPEDDGGFTVRVPGLPEVVTYGKDEQEALRVSVAGASAYLKIADGCRRPCAFCAIPLIKGTAVSRPTEAIIHEARQLRDAGVRELILIAQDTTDYGHDLGMKDGLAVLLEQLTDGEFFEIEPWHRGPSETPSLSPEKARGCARSPHERRAS